MQREYKPMRIYKLYRSIALDHEKGRPAIFLKYFGNQSLVWTGTSKLDINAKDKPLIINLNQKITYFYDKGLQKVLTKTIKSRWKNKETNKIFVLSEKAKEILVTKFQKLIFENKTL